MKEERVMYRRVINFCIPLVGGIVLGVGLRSENYIAVIAGAALFLWFLGREILAQKVKRPPEG